MSLRSLFPSNLPRPCLGILPSAAVACALAGLACCNVATPKKTLGACASPPTAPAASTSAAAAIREFLASDVDLAAVRDHDSERGPLHQSIARYVHALDDLGANSSAPEEFLRAMHSHRNAWFFMIEPLRAFAELRGEAHSLFRLLTAANHPNASFIQGQLDQVWATWSEVERVAGDYTALP